MNDVAQQEQELEHIYNNIPQSVFAAFSTRLTEYQLPEQLQIDISTELDEQALNQVVKEVLGQTMGATEVTFDFLVNGKLLRGKLKSHLVRYEMSPEEVVKVEYFIAFRQFEQMKETPVQDWVSCIAEVLGEETNIGVLASMFDGSVSFHDKPTKKQAKIKSSVHDAPIKAIKCIPSDKEDIYYIVTGGIEEELRVSKFGLELPIEVISINSHDGAVFAIDSNPNLIDGHVCTGGSSGFLNVWRIPQNFQDDESSEVKLQKKKKKKTNKKNLPFLASQPIHKDAINSLCWVNGAVVATGSSDHSIKLTDVEKMREARTFLTKDSITTGIDYCNNTILSAHEDGYIRTWDLRSQATSPNQTYKSHARFASCIRARPNSNIFASGSYDQTVKIWDTRSVFPLQTVATNYDKVFTLCWKSERELVSGGSSPFLTYHTL